MPSFVIQIRSLLVIASVMICGVVRAAYPDRPITLVVTYPPGGTADTVARILAPELSRQLAQSVVVENRGGAGGMIGGASVAKAPADGYTIMLDAANHAQNPALQPKMQFDTLKDFAPISLLLRVPNVIVVRPDSIIYTVADLVKAGREKGIVVHYATSGTGSAQHLAGELFNAMTGTHLEYVHYQGGNAGIMDVISGQVPLMFSSMGLAQQHVKSGKLRMVAVGGENWKEQHNSQSPAGAAHPDQGAGWLGHWHHCTAERHAELSGRLERRSVHGMAAWECRDCVLAAA